MVRVRRTASRSGNATGGDRVSVREGKLGFSQRKAHGAARLEGLGSATSGRLRDQEREKEESKERW